MSMLPGSNHEFYFCIFVHRVVFVWIACVDSVQGDLLVLSWSICVCLYVYLEKISNV